MMLKSPGDLHSFIESVMRKLDACGLARAARVLEKIQITAYTTSSEWLGELGLAVRTVQQQLAVNKSIDSDLEQIMNEVRKVWPALWLGLHSLV